MEYTTVRKLLLHAALVLSCLALARAKCQKSQLKYYLHQEFGQNELSLIAALRPPVAGSFGAGFGQEVVYEFNMTKTKDPWSMPLGFVRGTALSVNNTAAATVFFVSNVIHYDNGVTKGTISQQGEGVFNTGEPWEFAIVGGTGAFRNVKGYNIGETISQTRVGNSTVVVTHYKAHLSRCLVG